MFINLLAFFFLSTYLLYLMKLLYFNVCLWSLCIIVCIFISFITLHKTNKIIHNIKYNCNKNNLTEPFKPYNDSYEYGFSINNVLCSNLDVSQNLNTTADIKSTGNVIVKSIDNIKIQEETNKEVKTLLQTLYPIGSIYMSMNSTDPSTFIGGTWIQIDNKFLYCTKSGSGNFGGSDTVTLKTENLPSHNHGINITSKNTSINHRHGIYSSYDDATYNIGNRNEIIKSDIMSIPDDRSLTAPNNFSRTTYTNYSDVNHNHKVEGNTGSTGNGKSFYILPSYIKIYCWYKISDKLNDEEAKNKIENEIKNNTNNMQSIINNFINNISIGKTANN